jgi:hypothetical protein
MVASGPSTLTPTNSRGTFGTGFACDRASADAGADADADADPASVSVSAIAANANANGSAARRTTGMR